MYKTFKHRKHPCIRCLGEAHILFVIIRYFSLAFFLFILFATQLFFTPVTSSNLRNQAPLLMALRLLQATQHCT